MSQKTYNCRIGVLDSLKFNDISKFSIIIVDVPLESNSPQTDEEFLYRNWSFIAGTFKQVDDN